MQLACCQPWQAASYHLAQAPTLTLVIQFPGLFHGKVLCCSDAGIKPSCSNMQHSFVKTRCWLTTAELHVRRAHCMQQALNMWIRRVISNSGFFAWLIYFSRFYYHVATVCVSLFIASIYTASRKCVEDCLNLQNGSCKENSTWWNVGESFSY